MDIEDTRFKSHVDPAIYGIFRRIFHLAKNKQFPIAASGFTCSGHVYDVKLPAEQKKEYVSMATGKLEKIHPGAYMYLLFRTKGSQFEKAHFLHERILSINKDRANHLYSVLVESVNPSDFFPPQGKDLSSFEQGHGHLLVRYELTFLKPLSKLTPDEAREALCHFWQNFSDLIWSYESLKLFKKREIIQAAWFAYRGLGDDLLFG
ncbi:MAG: hypothetical protein Q7R76_02325 [Candidatus Woesearchaeota archaeon]|nr:hypothetical protein [Candidatus Woesearchaeota archaeon]